MSRLLLKKTGDHYGDPSWSGDDYVVLRDAAEIGRIMKSLQAPELLPWLWSITDLDCCPSVHNCGFAATREEAMMHFKSRWSALDEVES